MKKALNEPIGCEELINLVVTTLGMNIDGFKKVCQFLFFSKYDRSGPAINTVFGHTSYPSTKLAINLTCQNLSNMVLTTLGSSIWMVSNRFDNFRLFIKFHSSGLAIISSF